MGAAGQYDIDERLDRNQIECITDGAGRLGIGHVTRELRLLVQQPGRRAGQQLERAPHDETGRQPVGRNMGDEPAQDQAALVEDPDGFFAGAHGSDSEEPVGRAGK